MLIRSLFCLIFFIYKQVLCFTPNCIPQNQFINYEFPVEACSDYFRDKCEFHPKGLFKSIGDVSLVKIKETPLIPTCAFFNVASLRYIYGVNSKIKVLATKAFVNLPDVKAIHLAFNHIGEVKKGIFKNVSVELIDLSWNKIVFIDSQAFDEVVNLKHLNLSRNSLQTLSINHLARSVINLNISHNLLKTFLLNSNFFSNLSTVDASNNLIDKVAVSFMYSTENIDLTGNRIQDFDYMDISTVQTFRMGKNLFEKAPRYLENINAREIEIYPNPWNCDKLRLLWDTLISFNIRLAPRTSNHPVPECVTTEGSRLITTTRSTNCLSDHDCPSYMSCRANKCWDPCEESLCHSSSICNAKNHEFSCSCAGDLLANPLDIDGKCQKVECFKSSDCPFLGSTCRYDNKCVMYGSHQVEPVFEPLEETKTVVMPWWIEEIPNARPPKRI